MEKETPTVIDPNLNPVAPVAAALPKENPNEAFLGSLLVFALVILLLGIIGFFSFLGFRVWKQNQAVRSIPSIERLAADKAIPVAVTEPAPQVAPQTTPPVTQTPTPASAVNKATLSVKVLNGGSAKGVAGTFAETLKKAGYTKVTAGNSFGNYTGAAIFFAKGKNAEADALKADAAKQYPNVTVQEAPAGNKDASAADLVVILGK